MSGGERSVSSGILTSMKETSNELGPKSSPKMAEGDNPTSGNITRHATVDLNSFVAILEHISFLGSF